MKRISVFLLIIVLSFSSCNWDEAEEVNPVATLAALTTETQKNFIAFSNSEVAVYTGMLLQQVSGVNGRMLEMEQYKWLPEYFDGSWAVCYLGVFSNLSTIINLASENNLGKYLGVGRILLANALGMATDLWGDIPFSESFETLYPSLNPQYDSQQDIYEKIFQLLDLGMEDIANSSSEFYPAADDLFFNGNAQQWIVYANFLKLRYQLHLIKIGGIDPVYELLDKPMFSQPGQALVVDYGEINAPNPLNGFLSYYPGQVRASSSLVDLLLDQDDPRLPVFFKRNTQNQYAGSNPGAGDESASVLSETINSSASKIILASFTEQMFIAAEIYFRKGLLSQASLAFSEAVRSSLLDYDVFSDQWLQNYLANTELTLENIMTAKHTALFLQTETWNDWRRTGYPLLEASAGNQTNGVIPRRFPYPKNELLYNSGNVPSDLSITDPVWWDFLPN